MPRVASVVQPCSPSVGSDVSTRRDLRDRPFYPQEAGSPLSPQFSPEPTRDFFPSTALSASLPPLSQSCPAFSPAPNSPSVSRSLPPIDATPSLGSEHSNLSRPPSNSPPASHGCTAPAPQPVSTLNTFPSGLPPGLTPMGHLPVSSPTSSSDASTAVSSLPPLIVSSNTAASVSTPAQQPVPYGSQSRKPRHTNIHTDYYLRSCESNQNIDSQSSTVKAPISLCPSAAPRPPSRTSSPLGDYADTYEESDLAPSVQSPQPPSLLPRKRRDFKIILSLDGDGIRGLSQAFLVEALVCAICTKLDQHIDPYQIFDLVGGTSMGGVLGLMLSRLRMQAHSAREAYKLVAKEVFQDKKAYFISLDPHAVPALYDAQGVENAIKKVVAGKLPHVNARLYDDREDSADA